MGTLSSCPDYSIIVCQAVLLILIMITATISAYMYIVLIYVPIWICIKRFRDKIDAIIERVFDRILNKHCIQGERKVYKVLEYKAPHIYNILLFATFVGLIISAISEFWNQFLFEKI